MMESTLMVAVIAHPLQVGLIVILAVPGLRDLARVGARRRSRRLPVFVVANSNGVRSF